MCAHGERYDTDVDGDDWDDGCDCDDDADDYDDDADDAGGDGDDNDDDDDDDDDGDDDDQEEGVRRRVGSISLAGITGPEELELLEEEAHCESEVIFFLFFCFSII